LNIFRAVRTMMLNASIQRSKPIDDFPSPGGWDVADSAEENTANRLTLISMALPGVRAKAHELFTQPRTASTLKEVLSLVEATQRVDAALENWANTVPPTWGYTTVSFQPLMPEDLENAEEWQGPAHMYDDIFLANITNDYRVSRICCQSVLLGAAKWLALSENDLSTDFLAQAAKFTLQQMVDDICASVPFHTKYHYRTQLGSGQDEAAAEALGAYFLVWPLFVCLNSESIPKEQKAWVRGRLFYIGREFGLSQAQVLGLAQRHVLTCGPAFP